MQEYVTWGYTIGSILARCEHRGRFLLLDATLSLRCGEEMFVFVRRQTTG